jgi:hypothetical protein
VGEDENQWAHIWEARLYDFNVWTRRKQVEKLRYMHENPVEAGPGAGTGTVDVEQFPGLRSK